MIPEFQEYLKAMGKSHNTIISYADRVRDYLKWYQDTYGTECKKLIGINISDCISYLRNIKKQQPSTINSKVAALQAFNSFLIARGVQDDMAVADSHKVKIQTAYVNPCVVDKKEVDAFRQKVLLGSGARDHAIITVMAYGGLRISETLNLELTDIIFPARQIVVRSGKGDKQRVVFIGDVIINAVKEYLKVRESESAYLFVSRQSDTLDRTGVNRICKKFSDVITPHVLRHFYCSHALETSYNIHEVANQAGHSNIHTTLRYTNPNIKTMQEKAKQL